MSFIKESYLAYKKVQEAADHEISMARGELEAIADKATQLASMLQGKSDEGNPLEAWVQSKITKAKDYINSVSDYMMYNPKINESYELEENTFEKIYQMQQDGKSSEDIAKELKLNPALVKKVLGEQVELQELTDAQIAQLKKEYDPLKGKTITTSQYQQLKNILFKLQDGDLEKLQKQNIPFASTGAGSILRVRKSPVKITSVKVPGLEGMAEAIDMSKVTKYKMISIKGDQKEITIDRKDLEKHLKLGYVIKEPLTEEKIDLQEKPSRKKHVVFKIGDKLVAKDFRGYNDDEIAKSIDDFLKQNSKSIVVQQSPIQSVKESFKDNIVKKLVKPAQDYNKKAAEIKTIDMTDGSAHVRFPKDDTKAMEFYKSKGYKVTTKYEETELEEACWTGYKKVGMKKKGDRMVPNCVPEGYVTESGDIVEFVELNEGQFKEIDTRKGDLKLAKDKKQNLKDKYNAIMAGQATGDENAIADQIQKLEMSIKKQEQELIDIMKKQRETKREEVSKEKETEFHKKLDTLVHKTFGKRKDEKMPIKESHFNVNTQVLYKGQKAQIVQLKQPQVGNYYVVKLDSGENVEANHNELKLVENKINEGARALVEAITALQKKADKSGMPYSILKQVYDRGMAAWKGGHRPGASQHQWAFARVNSFVTKSSGTWGGADSDLAKKVKGKE
jgi:hypothetical protein